MLNVSLIQGSLIHLVNIYFFFYFRDLKFTIWDWDSHGSPDYIGTFHTNMDNLSQGPGPKNHYDCINEERQKKKGAKYKNSGIVMLQNISIVSVPSFLDYIQSGTQVNFTVAVDFTGFDIISILFFASSYKLIPRVFKEELILAFTDM